MTYKDVVENPLTSPSLLLVIYTDVAGLEGLTWDPEVVRRTINGECAANIPRENFNKLMAAINIATSDEYWKEVPSFVVLNNALYSGQFDPRVFDLATVAEFTVGLMESGLIWPVDIESEISVPVLEYMKATCDLEWFVIPPRLLQRLFPTLFTIRYDYLVEYKSDPLLYEAIFKKSVQKANEVDSEVYSRLTLSHQQASSLGLESTTRMYKETLDLFSQGER